MPKKIITMLMAMAIVLSISFASISPAIADPNGKQEAIEKGVKWLVEQQNTTDGSWDTRRMVGKTGLAVLKLETHAVQKYKCSPFDPAYPYADNVTAGLNYLFAHACNTSIGTQTHDGSVDNPDTNGNGIGVYFVFGGCGWKYPRSYETGITLMAIAASTTPDRIVNVPGSPVNGQTYRHVAVDTMNYLA
mgnify:CR=1 FL=1